MTALRISFHVYYGWTSLFVVPWIAYVPYRWRQVLWLFGVGHRSFDLLGLEMDGPANTQRAASAFFDVAVGAGAALGTYVLLSRIRSRVRSGDDRLGCPRSQSRRAVRVGEAPALVTADDRSPSFGHRVLG